MANIYKAPKTNSYKNAETPSKKDYQYCRALSRARKSKGVFFVAISSVGFFLIFLGFLFSRVVVFNNLSFIVGCILGITAGVILTLIQVPWFWSSIEKFHNWEAIEEVMGTSE